MSWLALNVGWMQPVEHVKMLRECPAARPFADLLYFSSQGWLLRMLTLHVCVHVLKFRSPNFSFNMLVTCRSMLELALKTSENGCLSARTDLRIYARNATVTCTTTVNNSRLTQFVHGFFPFCFLLYTVWPFNHKQCCHSNDRKGHSTVRSLLGSVPRNWLLHSSMHIIILVTMIDWTDPSLHALDSTQKKIDIHGWVLFRIDMLFYEISRHVTYESDNLIHKV